MDGTNCATSQNGEGLLVAPNGQKIGETFLLRDLVSLTVTGE